MKLSEYSRARTPGTSAYPNKGAAALGMNFKGRGLRSERPSFRYIFREIKDARKKFQVGVRFEADAGHILA